jgi:hypothetical protein
MSTTSEPQSCLTFTPTFSTYNLVNYVYTFESYTESTSNEINYFKDLDIENLMSELLTTTEISKSWCQPIYPISANMNNLNYYVGTGTY